MTHTPGEWEVGVAHSYENGRIKSTEYFVRVEDDDIAIASEILDPKTCQPSEANAVLLAAAPKLLETLEDLLDYYTPVGDELHRAGCALVERVRAGKVT